MQPVRNFRILFAGGCHVVGYPVGEQYAYPHVVARHLAASNITCRSLSLSHIALHHPERVVTACHEFQPDMLVLQLANYELGNTLGAYLLSRLGFKLKKEPNSSLTDVPVVTRRRYTVRSRFKQLIDVILGHPLVDLAPIEVKYEAFIAATAKCAGYVLLASPTPCADPVAQFYRLRALPMVEALAARHNCAYANLVDLGPAAEQRTVGREMFFSDAIHLGIAGQAAIGLRLATHIRKAVDSAAIKT